MGVGTIMSEFFSPISPLWAILTALAWFCPGVLIHLAICRISGAGKYMAKGLFCGFLLVFIMILCHICKKTVNLAVIYYVFTLWLAYMMFFVNVMNSITLKMLSFLAERGGTLDGDDFKAVFGGNSGVSARLSAIKANNFLREKDGILKITAKGRILVSCLVLLRKIIGITEVG